MAKGKPKADEPKRDESRGSEGTYRTAGTDDESVRLLPTKRKDYMRDLAGLQVELFKLQSWVASSGRPTIVILEGLGPAGKHTTATAIAEGLHKRVADVVTLAPPRKRERGQWAFQRFVERFPSAGKLVIFDGSWYHYPATERAMGICGEPELQEFLTRCAAFEQTLTKSGVTLIKYWFTAEDQEQDRRFRAHVADLMKLKQFYLREVVRNCDPLPVAAVRDMALELTDRPHAPWYVVTADDKRRARLNCMQHLISLVPPEQQPEANIAVVAGHNGLDQDSINRRVPEVF